MGAGVWDDGEVGGEGGRGSEHGSVDEDVRGQSGCGGALGGVWRSAQRAIADRLGSVPCTGPLRPAVVDLAGIVSVADPLPDRVPIEARLPDALLRVRGPDEALERRRSEGYGGAGQLSARRCSGAVLRTTICRVRARGDAGGGTRTPDTRIMIPLL